MMEGLDKNSDHRWHSLFAVLLFTVLTVHIEIYNVMELTLYLCKKTENGIREILECNPHE